MPIRKLQEDALATSKLSVLVFITAGLVIALVFRDTLWIFYA